MDPENFDAGLTEHGYVNLKLIQILQIAGYKHPYSSQYLAPYCLIIWYRTFLCQSSKDKKDNFFINTISYQDMRLEDICMCRGCELYDDYIDTFKENKWLYSQVINLIGNIEQTKQYQKQEVENIMCKFYQQKKGRYKQQKIIILLFIAMHIGIFYKNRNSLNLSKQLIKLKTASGQQIEHINKKLIDFIHKQKSKS